MLWEYLKQYIDQYHDWDEYLNLAAFSYNTSVHEGTRYTPHKLVFGKIARALSTDPLFENEPNVTYTEYLTNLFHRISSTQAIARENLTQAKLRSKHYYDRKANSCNFDEGDYVYLIKEPRKGKLGDQYSGPYLIVEKLAKRNVKLEIRKNRYKIVHEDKVKRTYPHHTL